MLQEALGLTLKIESGWQEISTEMLILV